MKPRWKLWIALAMFAAICVFPLLRSDSHARKAVEQTRRALHQQSFKTELAEFTFSTAPELRQRAAVLTNADFRLRATGVLPSANFPGPPVSRPEQPNLMETLGLNSALALWKEDKLPAYSGGDRWSKLHEMLDINKAELDAACRAALSGPIRFDLVASEGSILLRHLPMFRGLTQMLGLRALLDLQDGNKDAAFTNLLASTRLITAWEPEPAEISHLVQFSSAAIVYNSTWQLLQAHAWSDRQLAALQQEWESVDFFKGLPETAAFTRASLAAACEIERREPVLGLAVALRATRHSTQSAWDAFTDHLHRVRYHYHGIYEDEKDLLLFYRERELQLRNAVQASTWSQMRQLPGVTNATPFQPKYPSRLQVTLNSRPIGSGFQRGGEGLVARAAGAESRRRIIITALALERYRIGHEAYPKTLLKLVPSFLKSSPTDFMDGQPLRYQVSDDHRFVLYSVGLDCVDNGGKMRKSVRGRDGYGGFAGTGIPEGTDLVWPRPASAAEVQAYHAQELPITAEKTQTGRSH